MLCACCIALSACGGGSSSSASAQSDEELVAAIMKDNVDAFDSGMGSMAEEFAADEEMVALCNLVGIDVADYANAIESKISIEAGDVTVDGDKATAQLKVTMPDYNAMGAAVDKLVDEALASPEAENMTEDQLYAELGKALLTAARETDTKTITIPVELEKKSGEWAISNLADVEKAIEEAYSYSAS